MVFKIALSNFLRENLEIPNNITPNKVQQSSDFPVLVYQLITAQRQYGHDGSINLVFADYQFDVYSYKKQEAIEVQSELKELIEDFDGYINGIRVQGIRLTDEFDIFEEDTGLYREEREYRIQYKE